MERNLTLEPPKVNFFEQCRAARRKEKCRNCVYFQAPDLKCRIWPSDNLTTEKRRRGCVNFRRDIWGQAL